MISYNQIFGNTFCNVVVASANTVVHLFCISLQKVVIYIIPFQDKHLKLKRGKPLFPKKCGCCIKYI